MWVRWLLLLSWLCVSAALPDGSADAKTALESFIAGQYTETETQLQAALKTSDQKEQIHYLLGRLVAWLGNTDVAFDHFEKAVDIDPQNAEYHYRMAQMYGQKAQQASLFRKPGQARNTKKSLEKAIVLDPNHIDANFMLMGYNLDAPGILGGSKDEARRLADRIKSLDPIRGHIAWATIYSREKAPEKIEMKYRSAIQTVPDNPIPYLLLSAHLAQQKQMQDAATLLETYYQSHPENDQILRNLSAICLNLKKYDSAFEMAQRSSALLADSLAHAAMSPADQAITDAIAIRDRQLGMWYRLGQISAVSGQHLDQGIENLRNYLQYMPQSQNKQHAQGHYLLGRIYAHQKKRDLAKSEYHIALELNPKFKAAKKALKNLK